MCSNETSHHEQQQRRVFLDFPDKCPETRCPESSDWRETQWKELVVYLPYECTQTCAFCGKIGVSKDAKRTWSIAFLHHFLKTLCNPAPFTYTVLMSMVYKSLKEKTWRTDQVMLCKDCMDWASETCVYEESTKTWRMISNCIRFKRRNTKLHMCAFLPMDLLILFLHAPSESRQLEYRMMCRLLKLLAMPSGNTLQTKHCLYSEIPSPILQAVIHGVKVGSIKLTKGLDGLYIPPQSDPVSGRYKVSFHSTSSIAINVVVACHLASGQKRLVRNAPDVAKYIRKCSSLLGKEEEKKKAWMEWHVTGL
jgi:hypothetical protein